MDLTTPKTDLRPIPADAEAFLASHFNRIGFPHGAFNQKFAKPQNRMIGPNVARKLLCLPLLK